MVQTCFIVNNQQKIKPLTGFLKVFENYQTTGLLLMLFELINQNFEIYGQATRMSGPTKPILEHQTLLMRILPSA